MSIVAIRKDLKKLSSRKKADVYQRFFKTGKGEYGEGDVFLGMTMPNIRKVVKKHFKNTSLKDTLKLLTSKYHEERMTALLILVEKYQKADQKEKEIIYKSYLKNTKYINNWDLVDVTCHKIVGKHLLDKDRKILYKLAKSKDLWEKRISIISTMWFIKENQFQDTLKISKILLNDSHDLIHKAVGWSLREVGKKNFSLEESFLNKHYKNMPRTMLRYAIEKFPEDLRQKYLKGTI